MLQNDYLVAKIGVDTAENEPRKSDVSWPMRRTGLEWAKIAMWAALCEAGLSGAVLDFLPPRAVGPLACSGDRGRRHAPAAVQIDSAKTDLATTHHSFRGSFSAVSTPILATR